MKIKLNITLKEAQKDLDKIMTIYYVPNKVDNIYLPDSWFITPIVINKGKGCIEESSNDFFTIKKLLKK